MANLNRTLQDKRIINIAAEISDVADNVVPRILLQLQDVLESYPAGSPQMAKLKKDIWQYELLNVIVTTLKQDFNKILDGWNMAAKLCHILSQCCLGFQPSDTHQFFGVFVPNAMENLLLFARKIQNKYVKTSEVLEDTRAKILTNFGIVMDAISYLFSGHTFLTDHVVKSPWVLQMLLTDDRQTSVACLSLLQSANRMTPGLMGNVDEKVLHQILDELIYKLSATSNEEIASAATRTLLVICDSYSPVVELLCNRYRGLRPLLSKWTGHGFGRDLRRLQHLLDAGSMQQAELQKHGQAARVIQAWWRSYHTRKSLRKADKALATFQRSFRSKKELEERRKEEERLKSELEHVLLRRRKQVLREMRRKELDALELIPAAAVPEHLAKQQRQAAVKIQALVRGRQTRKLFDGRKTASQQMKAAVVIQRAARKFLDKLASRRKEPPSWQRPPGLTDSRRVELQNKILEWRENHKIQAQTPEAKADLHQRVQNMLRQNALLSKSTRRKQMHREALLGQLELDSSLLLEAPRLADMTEKDCEMFVSHSVPIATKARHNHNQELRLLQQPWWRKLGDEYQDQQYEEDMIDWKIF